MGNFSQWKYVLIAYALKGAMSTEEATNYLCNTIGLPTRGSTFGRSINMYVAQNMKETIEGRQHKGSWYIRVWGERSGEYRLDCLPDLQSRISYVKHAKYESSNNFVFDGDDFSKIISEFLDKDIRLDSDKILKYCRC